LSPKKPLQQRNNYWPRATWLLIYHKPDTLMAWPPLLS
jgi:hypothetical protein